MVSRFRFWIAQLVLVSSLVSWTAAPSFALRSTGLEESPELEKLKAGLEEGSVSLSTSGLPITLDPRTGVLSSSKMPLPTPVVVTQPAQGQVISRLYPGISLRQGFAYTVQVISSPVVPASPPGGGSPQGGRVPPWSNAVTYQILYGRAKMLVLRPRVDQPTVVQEIFQVGLEEGDRGVLPAGSRAILVPASSTEPVVIGYIGRVPAPGISPAQSPRFQLAGESGSPQVPIVLTEPLPAGAAARSNSGTPSVVNRAIGPAAGEETAAVSGQPQANVGQPTTLSVQIHLARPADLSSFGLRLNRNQPILSLLSQQQSPISQLSSVARFDNAFIPVVQGGLFGGVLSRSLRRRSAGIPVAQAVQQILAGVRAGRVRSIQHSSRGGGTIVVPVLAAATAQQIQAVLQQTIAAEPGSLPEFVQLEPTALVGQILISAVTGSVPQAPVSFEQAVQQILTRARAGQISGIEIQTAGGNRVLAVSRAATAQQIQSVVQQAVGTQSVSSGPIIQLESTGIAGREIRVSAVAAPAVPGSVPQSPVSLEQAVQKILAGARVGQISGVEVQTSAGQSRVLPVSRTATVQQIQSVVQQAVLVKPGNNGPIVQLESTGIAGREIRVSAVAVPAGTGSVPQGPIAFGQGEQSLGIAGLSQQQASATAQEAAATAAVGSASVGQLERLGATGKEFQGTRLPATQQLLLPQGSVPIQDAVARILELTVKEGRQVIVEIPSSTGKSNRLNLQGQLAAEMVQSALQQLVAGSNPSATLPGVVQFEQLANGQVRVTAVPSSSVLPAGTVPVVTERIVPVKQLVGELSAVAGRVSQQVIFEYTTAEGRQQATVLENPNLENLERRLTEFGNLSPGTFKGSVQVVTQSSNGAIVKISPVRPESVPVSGLSSNNPSPSARPAIPRAVPLPGVRLESWKPIFTPNNAPLAGFLPEGVEFRVIAGNDEQYTTLVTQFGFSGKVIRGYGKDGKRQLEIAVRSAEAELGEGAVVVDAVLHRDLKQLMVDVGRWLRYRQLKTSDLGLEVFKAIVEGSLFAEEQSV